VAYSYEGSRAESNIVQAPTLSVHHNFVMHEYLSARAHPGKNGQQREYLDWEARQAIVSGPTNTLLRAEQAPEIGDVIEPATSGQSRS
jgi:hypothetical protein